MVGGGQAPIVPLASITRGASHRAEQYLGYLQTSRQRRRVRWWHAAGREAGLEPATIPALASGASGTLAAPREPLRLLAFTRSESAAWQQIDTTGGRP